MAGAGDLAVSVRDRWVGRAGEGGSLKGAGVSSHNIASETVRKSCLIVVALVQGDRTFSPPVGGEDS